jgi:hypothetical protein
MQSLHSHFIRKSNKMGQPLLLLLVSLLVLSVSSLPLDDPVVAALPLSFAADSNILRTNFDRASIANFQAPPKTRLEQTLMPGLTANLTQAVNANGKLFSKPLVDITQSRVLIVSASEYKTLLDAGITRDEIDNIAVNNYINYAPYTIGCMGKVVLGDGSELAYLEAKCQFWGNMRTDLEGLFKTKVAKLGAVKRKRIGVFAADLDHFNPHIAFAATSMAAYDRWDDVKLQGKCLAKTEIDPDAWLTNQV